MRWSPKLPVWLLFGLVASPLPAQDRGPLVYLDVLSLAVGAAQSQIHIRTGVETEGPWAFAGEAGLAWTGGGSTSVSQFDLVALVRHREGPGPTWAAGGGLLAALGAAGPNSLARYQGLAVAEAGWSWGGPPAWSFEPYVRGVVLAGPTLSKGRKTTWDPPVSFVPTIGFRLGFFLPQGGRP